MHGRRRPLAGLALAALALGAALACRREAPPAPLDASYTVRGEVSRLPGATDRSLWIHHEAIRGFKDMFGEVTDMGSMTMPFTPAPRLDLAGLAAGDKIEFRLEVRWKAETGKILVVAVRKLPSGTQLDFGAPPSK